MNATQYRPIHLSITQEKSALPHLFAYDISQPRRARKVLNCLRSWRADGQLSAHEVWTTPSQTEALAVALLELVNRTEDKLLVARLDRQGQHPITALAISSARQPPLHPRTLTATVPRTLPGGWYLLAYDVSNQRRLQRLQRQAARMGVQLQRSLYLYHGQGATLVRILTQLVGEIKPGEDDLRLYRLSGPERLWFLCGTPPPLDGMS